MVPTSKKEQNLIFITQIVYILQVFSAFFGVFPVFIPYIINLMYKDQAKNTWLEDHFKWQMQTFWFTAIFGGLIFFFLCLLVFFGRTSHLLIPLPVIYLSPLFFCVLILCQISIMVMRTIKGWKKFIDSMDEQENK